MKGLGLLLALILVSSCTPQVYESAITRNKEKVQIVKKGSFLFSEEEEKYIEMEAKVFEIPIPDREEIRRYVSYFLKNKQQFEKTLQRANYYMPIVKPIVESYRMPAEIALLPAIESSFNPFAVSRSGAAGLWQFIPSTAKRYGLRIDDSVDERFDIVKSTHAAMRYLSDLYNIFGNWELALASYNCGENCVLRKTGGNNFWDTKDTLPQETQNYVPAFFAVLLLTRFPERYGIDVKVPNINVTVKELKQDVQTQNLLNALQINSSLFKDLNPHIKGETIPSGTYIYLPREQENKRIMRFGEPKVIILD